MIISVFECSVTQKEKEQQLFFILLHVALPPEESTRSIEYCTFDGTKSNYLFNQVNKWFVLEDWESRLEI